MEISVISDNPIEQFCSWYEAAISVGEQEVNAMTLATVDVNAKPHARIVLLKGYSEQGFRFFSHYQSPKGLDLAKNPAGALVFYWPIQGRQVRIEGKVVKLSAAESDAYFQSRSQASQISAHVSTQSQRLAARGELLRQFERLAADHQHKSLPRPQHWGGYQLVPERIEFMQQHPDRLNDRVLFVKTIKGWQNMRLQP